MSRPLFLLVLRLQYISRVASILGDLLTQAQTQYIARYREVIRAHAVDGVLEYLNQASLALGRTTPCIALRDQVSNAALILEI